MNTTESPKQPTPAALASSGLLAEVRKGMKNMTAKRKEWPVVAMLAGPSECIEIIVRKASAETGIEMDWEFFGGRALIHSPGDRDKCRSALYLAIPQSDLNQGDI